MNQFVERRNVIELACGSDFAYILKSKEQFHPSQYKAMKNQGTTRFISCMKMMYNGNIEILYLPGNNKTFASMLPTLDASHFMTIVGNLLSNIIDVKNHGFLYCQNIDLSFEKIYVDSNTYKISMVYVPISVHASDDLSTYENELRTNLIRTISTMDRLRSPETMRLSEDLKNGMLSLEALHSRIGRYNGVPEPITNHNTMLRLLSKDAPQNLQFVMTKSVFTIGRKETNDGVVSYNKMVGRTHCRIEMRHGQHWVTDLQSVNGTFVNQTRLQSEKPQLLENGDILRLANGPSFRVVIE